MFYNLDTYIAKYLICFKAITIFLVFYKKLKLVIHNHN